MDIQEAINKHGQWRVHLRTALIAKQTLDDATISRHNQCELGKWLYSEAKAKYGTLASYKQAVEAHTTFHKHAAEVARVINRHDEKAAMDMLATGSPYSAASTAVGVALLALQRDIGS